MLVSSLRTDDDKLLQNNYRPVQNLHGRWVLASFQTSPSVKHAPGKEYVECAQAAPSCRDEVMGRAAEVSALCLLQKHSICMGYTCLASDM